MSAVITQTGALSQLATTPELVLQPGTMIDARVLATAENLARILIAGHAIEVLSEIVLQPGAKLKFAVSEAADGTVRLAIVPQDTPSTTRVGVTAQPAASKIVSALAPSSPEAIVVSHAVQTSAPRQESLSPLFANLPVVVAARSVPEQVQHAALQLLATRAPLDRTLTAGDLRQAFQKSGLFLEATLARGAAPAGAPDLKAALVVFKQVLTNWLGPAVPTAQSSPVGASPVALSQLYSLPQNSALAAASPVIAPAAISAAGLPAKTAVAAADMDESATEDQAHVFSSAPTPPAARAPAGAPGEIVSTAARALSREAAAPSRGPVPPTSGDPAIRRSTAPAQPVAARQPSDPAPPVRGALPSAQPVASPSLATDAAPTSIGQQLLEQTDAALARQTLLQVASLPDRAEPGGTNQNTQSRWSFEIPFATPRGTAVAQFEIARDGGNDVEAASPSRVWRARFSLDVEPAGPVHALVSLVGDKAAVRMWAERPGTAADLRANADALSLALRQADLEPGDILVDQGAPQQARLPAGQFLNRAT